MWNASRPAGLVNEARKMAAKENDERWEILRERIWKEVETKEREKERKKRELEDDNLEIATPRMRKRRRIMEDVTNISSGSHWQPEWQEPTFQSNHARASAVNWKKGPVELELKSHSWQPSELEYDPDLHSDSELEEFFQEAATGSARARANYDCLSFQSAGGTGRKSSELEGEFESKNNSDEDKDKERSSSPLSILTPSASESESEAEAETQALGTEDEDYDYDGDGSDDPEDENDKSSNLNAASSSKSSLRLNNSIARSIALGTRTVRRDISRVAFDDEDFAWESTSSSDSDSGSEYELESEYDRASFTSSSSGSEDEGED
jgi:hypothetical protein